MRRSDVFDGSTNFTSDIQAYYLLSPEESLQLRLLFYVVETNIDEKNAEYYFRASTPSVTTP